MAALAFHTAAGSRATAAPVRMRWLRALAGMLSRFMAEWRMRREIHAVEGLDDAMLRDIGLTRGSVEDAVRRGRTRF